MPKAFSFNSLLINVKKSLDAISSDKEKTSKNKKIELNSLIRSVGAIIKKDLATLDCMVAAWFLLSSLYVELSLQLAPTDLDKAHIALHQAIFSLQQISKNLSIYGEESKLDLDFIIQCNTFGTADVVGSIEKIQSRILPDLLHMSSKSDELFKVVGGSSLSNESPVTSERPSIRLG